MPPRPVRVAAPAAPLFDFAAVRAELGVPGELPAEVLAEARSVAARGPSGARRRDATDLPLITIDPEGSRDLDQALYVQRYAGGGYVVWYAIADVAAFVVPGGAVDREAWARGTTLYSPDGRTPLHPPELSEGAASLLPGVDRAALLWRIIVQQSGELDGFSVERALVRSREQLSYVEAQARIDDDEVLGLLREVGELREAVERERGGVSLRVPEQEVSEAPDDGGWELHYRAPLPVERWNAQISLLCGTAAAQLMLHEGLGLLRTVPPPSPDALEALRRTARAVGVAWAADVPYPAFVHSLDPAVPAHAAVLRAATGLMRGAGYAALVDGVRRERGGELRHAALAVDYAHVTAPLRRLADRYASEVCVAAFAGEPVPAWVLEALPRLPEAMQAADRRARALDRAVVDLVEASVLAGREGEEFAGVIVDADAARGTVQLASPAVRGRVDGQGLPVGEAVQVRLVSVDVAARTVRFALASAPPSS